MVRSMAIRFKVIVDNKSYRADFESDWGLSIFIDVDGARILFDAGGNPEVFRRNMLRHNIIPSEINYVVISHSHYDHCGGLQAIAEDLKQARIYIPRDRRLLRFIRRLGLEATIITDLTKIHDRVYVKSFRTRVFGIVEQSMAIVCRRGLIILCGCSHPGISNIVRGFVEELSIKPYLVMGGFHGPSISEVEELIRMGVERIAPMHCSGYEIRYYLMSEHPDIYMDSGAGHEFVIEAPF